MDRRSLPTSDQRLFKSTSSLVDDYYTTTKTHINASEFEGVGADILLSQCLIVGRVITTTSSFATKWQSKSPPARLFHNIGEGLQGIVYEFTGTNKVVKVAKPSSKPHPLHNEFDLHYKVFSKFREYRALTKGVHVPEPLEYLNANTEVGKEWWSEQQSRFTAAGIDQTPNDILVSERIFPVPTLIRNAIIDKFCAETRELQDPNASLIKSDHVHKHALLRLYLGQETGPMVSGKEGTGVQFKLRNFPLYLGWVTKFGLDVVRLSQMLGSAVSIIHWGAGVDAEDIEFVLGTRVIQEHEHQGSIFQDRKICLFVIDFGMCSSVPRNSDDKNIHKFGKGILGNDPYYPHPTDNQQLWTAFAKAYIDTSKIILARENLDLTLGERVIAAINAFMGK